MTFCRDNDYDDRMRDRIERQRAEQALRPQTEQPTVDLNIRRPAPFIPTPASRRTEKALSQPSMPKAL
jgi:hypothetical protein